MMHYLTLDDVLELHRLVIVQSGGSAGIRDLGLLESAIAQPTMTFDGKYLYESLGEKAAAFGFSLIKNHPFIDGNKRMGHAAMEVFLVLNGFEIDATVDEQERVILALAAGETGRDEFSAWLLANIVELETDTNLP